MALNQFDGELDSPAPDAESKGELRRAVVTLRNRLYRQHPNLRKTMPVPRKDNVWVRQGFSIEPYFADHRLEAAVNLENVDRIRLRLRGLIERLVTHKPRKMSVGLEESSTMTKLPIAHEHLLAAMVEIAKKKRELIADAIRNEYAEGITLRAEAAGFYDQEKGADAALEKLYREMATGQPILDWR